jgi:hypothetical protein
VTYFEMMSQYVGGGGGRKLEENSEKPETVQVVLGPRIEAGTPRIPSNVDHSTGALGSVSLVISILCSSVPGNDKTLVGNMKVTSKFH